MTSFITYNSPVTVVNTGAFTGYFFLNEGGSFTNLGPGGSISGVVGISHERGTVTNSGTIHGSAYGVALSGGGTITNLAGGLIESGVKSVYIGKGSAAADNPGGAAAVYNDGTILSSVVYGIDLRDSGRITNGTDGLIQGYRGGMVLRSAGITIDNFGTIIGQNGTAIVFNSGYETLKIEPGSEIVGAVAGIQASDTFDFVDTQVTDVEASNGTLTLLNNGVTVASLGISQELSGRKFAFSADGQGGVNVRLAVPNGPTITGEYSVGLVLTDPATQNPTTIAANGTINPVSGEGVLGLASTAWTLTNLGTIAALSTDFLNGGVDGIELQSSGLVSNGASGLIRSSRHGVELDAGGSVVNRGLITGSGNTNERYYYQTSGTRFIAAFGESGTGVLLKGAGDVANYGTIQGSGTAVMSGYGYYNYFAPVRFFGAKPTGIGVGLMAGGSVTNAAGGLIQGNYRGINVTGGAGAVTNEGSIAAAGGAGVRLDAGGSVVNGGRIIGTGNNVTTYHYYGYNRLPIGDTFASGRYLYLGQNGVYGQVGAGVVFNGSGDLVNSGTILGSGFSIVNNYQLASFGGTGGTLISDVAAGIGANLLAGGSVTNAAGGLVEGSYRGINIAGARGTVVNAGTISGGSAGAAVQLDSSFGGLVVVDPGAVFVGAVSGGKALASKLELASAASTGTLSGLGTQFVHFGSITVDPGAAWLLTGNNTIASGVALTNAGSLSFTGTLDDAGTLIGTDGTAISFAGAGGLLIIEQDAIIQGTIGGFLQGATIDLAGITATAITLDADNVLSVQESGGGTLTFALAANQAYAGYGFTVSSDGSGGTDINVVQPGVGATTFGHDQTVDLTSVIAGLATPGLHGDTKILTAVSASLGSATLVNGVVTYTAPSTGSDTISYTVTDGFGNIANGSVNFTVDPGPTAGTGAITVGHDTVTNPTSSIAGLVIPGLAGDIETVTAVSAAHGSATVVNGAVSYTAPSSGSDTLSYTVSDRFGQIATGSISVTIDQGPAAGTGAIVVGHDKAVDLTGLINGLVTAGLSGDSETVTAISAAHGSVTLTHGVISYTAPANGPDTVVYTVTDQFGDTATGRVNVTVDPGPAAGIGAITLGHDKAANLTSLVNGLLGPGLPSDIETVIAVSAAYGSVTLVNGVITYTSPSFGPDTLSYTVSDQFGDTAIGSVNVTVDPGPSAGTGAINVAANQSADLTSLINGLVTPGLTGDTETVTAISAAHGAATLVNGVITYTAPSSGPDTLSYTVADKYGDIASGSVNVTVTAASNPGPTANAASVMVFSGRSTDMTSYLLSIVTPGVAGDTLKLTGDNTVGTRGRVTLTNGDLSYLAPTSGTDSFGYTVSDQRGNTASAKVTETLVTNTNLGNVSGTVVLGSYNGSVTFGNGSITVFGDSGNVVVTGGNGTNAVSLANGNNVVTLGNGSNTVVEGNGNDVLNLGNGSNTITLGNGNDTLNLGNGSNTIAAGNGNDVLNLGNGSNTITIGNGNDVVNLGNGANKVSLGTGNDVVNAGNGNNTIIVSGSASSHDIINVGAGNNVLTLGAGTYNVHEGNGANIILLGNGKYNVTAGSSTPDQFIYSTPSGLLTMPFSSNDELVFRNSGFELGVNNGHGTATLQTIAATLFSPNTDGTFATTANRFAYNAANGNLYYDASGSAAGSSRVLIGELTNHPHLTAARLFFTS